MRLARYRHDGTIRWGVVDTGATSVQPIAGPFSDWAPLVTTEGPSAIETAGAAVALSDVTLLAPIEDTAEIAGVDMTYGMHTPPPGADPPYWEKPRNAVVGPGDELRFPELIQVQAQCQFGYEVELVAVLGRTVTDPAHAIGDVLGYTVGNDGTLAGTRPSFVAYDLFGGKAGLASTSLGPWIVTRDELGDAPDLAMSLRINGTVRQAGRTSELAWPVAELVEETAWRLQLLAGDVVFTGTCGFVDELGRSEPAGHYIAGDAVEAEIEGIGVLGNTVEATDPYPIHVFCRWAGDQAVPGIRRIHAGASAGGQA